MSALTDEGARLSAIEAALEEIVGAIAGLTGNPQAFVETVHKRLSERADLFITHGTKGSDTRAMLALDLAVAFQALADSIKAGASPPT